MTAGALVAPGVRAQEVTVFAARSLRTALDEVGAAWAASTGGRVEDSYGTTLALAQEIDAGAPVDVFISGDPDWMDYLDGRGVIQSATIVKLLRNRLVLVAPARSDVAIEIAPGSIWRVCLGTVASRCRIPRRCPPAVTASRR